MGQLDYGDDGSAVFNAGKLITVWSDNSNSTNDNPNGPNSRFDLDVATILV